MLLSYEAHPHQIKDWLGKLNLDIALLRKNIKLNRAATTLLWPLYITTCQDNKLLYIAPPNLGDGLTDTPAGERIRTLVKAREHLDIARALQTIPHSDQISD